MRKDIWKFIGIALVVFVAIARAALVDVEAHPTGTAVQSQSEESSVAIEARHIGGLPTTQSTKSEYSGNCRSGEAPRKIPGDRGDWLSDEAPDSPVGEGSKR